MIDKDYFSRRATAERAAAIRAKTMRSVRAHMDMAREYETKVRAPEHSIHIA